MRVFVDKEKYTELIFLIPVRVRQTDRWWAELRRTFSKVVKAMINIKTADWSNRWHSDQVSFPLKWQENACVGDMHYAFLPHSAQHPPDDDPCLYLFRSMNVDESFSVNMVNSLGLIQHAKNIFYNYIFFLWSKSWTFLFHKYIFGFALICKCKRFLVEKNSLTKIFIHSVTVYIWDPFYTVYSFCCVFWHANMFLLLIFINRNKRN